jgi:hypothetical protein
MPEVSTTALQEVIRHRHRCESRFLESVSVTEVFYGQTVWDGDVQVFDLIGFPNADRAYAWSYETEDEPRRRFFVILHRPPVDSPRNAVQAALVSEYGGSGSDGT